jgi:RNA polymerase sigma factor (sigma-70 family)
MSTGRKYTDEELIHLLQQKNKSALEYLYGKYAGLLFGIILKILNGNEKIAEVSLQEVFVKILNRIIMYDRNKSTFFIWMLKIAREVCVDKMNSTAREAIHSSKSNVYTANGQAQNMVLDQVETDNYVKYEHKTIFDMVFYGGYTQKEISEKLNIPVEKVCIETRAALIEIRNKIS